MATRASRMRVEHVPGALIISQPENIYHYLSKSISALIQQIQEGRLLKFPSSAKTSLVLPCIADKDHFIHLVRRNMKQ